MPSVRMKNSSMGCLRGKNGLHVCQKSHMMSKRSCSQVTISQLAAEYGTCAQDCNDSNSVKISQLAAEYGACTQNSNYISSTNEVIAQDVERVDSTDGIELPSREDTHLKKQPPSLDNHAAHHRMETTLVSCCTNLETIFSPTVQKVTANGPDIDKDEGSNNDSDIFQSRAADESDGNSGSSSDHQTCNLSDFYISDMFLSGFPFDTSSLCNDIAETNPLPEYGAAESSLFLDATEQRMTLPHLHDSAESNDMQNTGPCDETKVHGDDSSFFLAIHQMSPRDQVHNCSPYPDSEEAESFDPHSFIRNLPELSDIPPNTQPTLLPRASGERTRITLVLDLDETLVHSSLDYCEDANFTFTVFFNLKEHTVYVKERPHLRTFLKRVAEMFEVVIFTASQSIYAKQLLDILDPDGKLISQRQYRESCIFSDGTYTKDLTVLGVDLAKVVIIDNCPQVFRLQVNNGIPIKSWFDDPSDNELISLIPFLETLVDVDDVRPIVAKRFGNKE